MISIHVFSDNSFWNKRIKKKSIFFNTLIKFFPRKYIFVKKKISLTVLLSQNKNIKKLNKKFRNKNKPTDILSFPTEKKFNVKKNPYLGDIIISYDFMNKPKLLTNFEFKKKLIKIFIHGFLHLFGYNHVKLKDFKKMLKEEEKIYKFINLKIKKLA
jgi:probable rRNA maturation factor|tara:strand:+ start:1152 stop:1622 length:471 start_codon:yes stop_codon:yes gene_type:complete